ncbi:peptidoglycan-binding protein LysM [Gordonia spumicola]|uniref:Peptidoglycan-binding protein LysM n=1 Tax=Gordonia spumicola TaxID=589161 RepID=A0A7I9VB86_9ACTN|nr:LysM peptidoglycan-binding domain-containing protein [Gordonia spumicola]GEE02585.1 peptidoglycan-binding protein LysM [Gordonia spumicola]
MSQALINRPVIRTTRDAERVRNMAMTCDISVIDESVRTDVTREADTELCRPTGRDRRRTALMEAASRRPEPHWEVRERRLVGAAGPLGSNASSAVSRRSNTAAVIRRRRIAGAVLVGAVMAGTVWILSIIAGSYGDAVTPDVPAATQVIHVRSGESLTDIARRIAPDLPTEGVVAQIRAMNGLDVSGLRVSQSLVAPAYR